MDHRHIKERRFTTVDATPTFGTVTYLICEDECVLKKYISTLFLNHILVTDYWLICILCKYLSVIFVFVISAASHELFWLHGL